MRCLNFKSTVTKGNNKGTGFIRFPIDVRDKISIGDQYKVTINSNISYYPKIRNLKGKGVFVPAHINTKEQLYKQKVNVKLKKEKGFHTKIRSDGGVYIPNSYDVKHKDIILLKTEINGKEIKRYSKVRARDKYKTKELLAAFDPKSANKEAIIQIKSNFNKTKFRKSNQIFNELLKGFDFAEVEKEKIVIFYGNRVSIIIKNNFKLKNLAYYLGCYFSDGIKKGNSWGISASTFEQANYFIKKHKEIIFDLKVNNSLTYTTNNKNLDKEKKRLIKDWFKNTELIIKDKNVRMLKTQTKYAPNRNEYGSALIKENRQLTQIFYNRLLALLFKTILKSSDKELATNFICGTMEGDGCLNSKKRGHIMISSNDKEIKILKRICDKSHFKSSSIRKWRGHKNRADLFIGSLEIITNISLIKDKLFKYYPKRRSILKKRLAKTGCVKFLLGKNKKTSNYLIGHLKKHNIIDSNIKLTSFGKQIKKDLKILLEEK